MSNRNLLQLDINFIRFFVDFTFDIKRGYIAAMNIADIRLANLNLLIGCFSLKQDFAVKAGIRPSQISQIRNKQPMRSGIATTLGNELARRIEENLELPEHWMDTLQTSVPEHVGNTSSAKDPSEKAIVVRSNPKNLGVNTVCHFNDGDVWSIPSELFSGELPDKLADSVAATKITGSGLKPAFINGSIIAYDQLKAPKAGSTVLVLYDGKMGFFEFLFVDGNSVNLCNLITEKRIVLESDFCEIYPVIRIYSEI